MQRRLDDIIGACMVCAHFNKTSTKVPAVPIVSMYAGERIIGDLTLIPGTYEHAPFKWLLVVVDNFSKYVWGCPLKTKDCEPVALAFFNIISEIKFDGRNSVEVRLLHTDNGTEFVNSVLQQITSMTNVHKIQGSPYTTTSQGIVEKKNDTIKKKIFKCCDDEGRNDWHTHLPDIIKNENNAAHKVTGMRPHLLFKGYDDASYDGGDRVDVSAPLSNLEHNIMKNKAAAAMLDAASQSIEASSPRCTVFKAGDHVLVALNPPKPRSKKTGSPKWNTRGTVHGVMSGNRYKMRLSNAQVRTFGSKHMKKYRPLPSLELRPSTSGTPELQVSLAKSVTKERLLGNTTGTSEARVWVSGASALATSSGSP